jgi:hypothetical protein
VLFRDAAQWRLFTLLVGSSHEKRQWGALKIMSALLRSADIKRADVVGPDRP